VKKRKLASAIEEITLKGKPLRLVTRHKSNKGDNKVQANKVHISKKQCQLYLAVNSNNTDYLLKHIVSQNTIPAQKFEIHCQSNFI